MFKIGGSRHWTQDLLVKSRLLDHLHHDTTSIESETRCHYDLDWNTPVIILFYRKKLVLQDVVETQRLKILYFLALQAANSDEESRKDLREEVDGEKRETEACSWRKQRRTDLQ